MADERAPPAGPSRVQFANFAAYRTLLSIVNLLNLPLADGTFFPPRGAQLTVMNHDVERLRMLKRELDPDDPAAVRGFLVAPKALLLELQFLLHQFPGLPENRAFFDDLARLHAAMAGVETAADAAEVRDLAYKLSVMLPFYQMEDAMRDRNSLADRWYAARERPRAP
ncbi:MAG TPA: hypothetical protein VHH36_07060 [Candidatus Thermoplasmatota archaeon]|nr:hypothetical protein [Candidatus Thermoplasmatota archaeon]